MKYVSIICFAVVLTQVNDPAWAGNGNALAGGWNGSVTGGFQSSAPAPAPTTAAPSASIGIFTGSTFSFGSGGGSSGNTGGAPSPQVNATLGLMLVGGTVAFLRRRRTRRA